MSWSTNLFCKVEFSRCTYNNVGEVEDRIRELTSCISTCIKTLNNLALITEPQKFFTSEEGNILFQINEEVEDNIELLEEYYIERYKLRLLSQNWDQCHNEEGLAIDPPSNIHWDSAFLEGDFIKSIKHPNNSELYDRD